MQFAKRVFRVGAIYGFLALIPHYFMEAKIGADQPPAITHPEFFYGFVGVALAAQIMFWLIANDPTKYRPFMLIAVFEKLSFVIPLVVLYFTRGLHPALYAPAAIDLLFAILFAAAYRKTEAA